MPLVINLTATYERLALALDTRVPDMARVYGERQANPIQAETVADGPVKEVVLRGDAADLSALPIPFHNELDAGPYVTGGVMILKGPRYRRPERRALPPPGARPPHPRGLYPGQPPRRPQSTGGTRNGESPPSSPW